MNPSSLSQQPCPLTAHLEFTGQASSPHPQPPQPSAPCCRSSPERGRVSPSLCFNVLTAVTGVPARTISSSPTPSSKHQLDRHLTGHSRTQHSRQDSPATTVGATSRPDTSPAGLGPGSEWQDGQKFPTAPEDSWPFKSTTIAGLPTEIPSEELRKQYRDHKLSQSTLIFLSTIITTAATTRDCSVS